MVMEARLADGRVLKFPNGTDPAVIQTTVQRVLGVQEPVTEQALQPRARGGRAGRGAQLQEERLVEREQFLSSLAPERRELLESITPVEAGLIGAGRGFTTLARGVGLAEQEDPASRQAIEELSQIDPGVRAGEILAEAAPFVVPGAAVGRIVGTGARFAASGALGASEGGIISAGKGGGATQVATSAFIGLLLGAGGEALLPVVNSLGRKLINKVSGKGGGAPVTGQGQASPDLEAVLAERGASVDDLIAASSEVAQGDVAGNAAREAAFNRLGLTPTEAQRTRDVDLFVEQQDAFRKSGEVRRALDLQETQLTEKTAEVVSAVESTASPASVIDAVTDRSLRLDEEIGDLYTVARERAGTESNIRLSSAVGSLKSNSPRNEVSGGTVKALRDQMAVMGVASPKGFKTTGRINVQQSEELRQFANSLVEGANPQGRRVIRDFKESLDDDVFKVAGEDVFNSARKAKTNFERGLTKESKNKFDKNRTSLVRDILENRVAGDDLGNIIRAGSKYKAADLADLKRYLFEGSPEDVARGAASWNDIRGSAMEFIRDTAFTGPIRADGTKSLSRAGLERSFKSIGNDKLRVLFNEKERKFLKDLAEVAAFKEPPPGTFTGTGPSGLAIKKGVDRILQLGSRVPGAGIASDVLGGVVDRNVTRSQAKKVLTLSSDAEKIAKANEKQAFQKLRKSQLGDAAASIPLLAIPALQEEL